MRYLALTIAILGVSTAHAAEEVRVRAEETCDVVKVEACLTNRPKNCDKLLGLICAEAGLKLARAGESARAAPYLNRACRLGVGPSCMLLGEQHLAKGEQDTALIYFTQACLTGHLPACGELKKRMPTRKKQAAKQESTKPSELGPAAKAWIETHVAPFDAAVKGP